ncbi:aminotransferase class III-fold pyridoxal phosphate-dependent enzyme [Roseomonas sp. CAU 1739]|uniref:aspartate aminotransferase family protein n=1 Tax=Roseomonas sp. CAU 1739 TaxID=3140364 RepID=UPI00325A5A5E
MSPLDAPRDPRNSDLEAALIEAREAYSNARPRSAEIHAKAREVMPGGNTRTVLFYTPFPTAMVRGEGARLWDADGREYLDLCGEYTAGLFGHSEQRIIAAVAAAMAKGINLAAVGENEGKLAAIICRRFPSVEQVRFTNSGTEANIMALAGARGFTGRTEILAFRGGYHGGVFTFPVGVPTSPVNLPIPMRFADYNDAAGAAAAIREAGDKLAAVIVEPMQGSGGCIPATREFLQALRDTTKETGALLIFDEVMTSRHAFGGLQARLGITPDMTTFGKYMAGGMSFGAFGGRADVMAMFDGHRPGAMPHAGTFNNNVLSMAAGNVAMGEIFDEAAAEALFARGEALRDACNAACAKHGLAMHFTGVGSMLNPHFRPGPITAPYKATPVEEQQRELFFFDMLGAGVYLARRGMVALMLPVTDADCARFVAAVEEFCAARKPVLTPA